MVKERTTPLRLDSPDCPELLSIDRLAEVLGISRRTIEIELQSRTFPYKPVRIGKRYFWPRESLREQMKNGVDVKNGKRRVA